MTVASSMASSGSCDLARHGAICRTTSARTQAFRQALGNLGYAEGENIAVEYRFAGGDKDARAALAAELVALKPDVIVVGSDDCILAVHKVTQTIPVVGVGLSFDLLNLGLITSHAHPGGNVTGFYLAITRNLRGKRVSLLKEMAPRITRIGMVYNPGEFGDAFLARSLDCGLVGALLISLLALAAPVAALGVVIFFLWPRNASDPSSLSKRAAGPSLDWPELSTVLL